MSPPTPTPVLALEDVHKTFDETRAVDGVSLAVRPGTIFGLLGRNGAGKTTTLRMIAGIFHPDRGSIRVQGEPWSTAVRDRLGYLPEERGLYKKMRVLDHLLFLAEIKGLAATEARRRASALLERFGLAERAADRVEELSKGNQQKVQLAGVLIAEPPLLLLDEPTSGLDPVNVVVVRQLLLELRARGATIVLSTHQMAEAQRLCDEVCLIHRGRVVLAGTVAEVRATRGQSAVHVEFDQGELEPATLPGVEDAKVGGNRAELRIQAGLDTNRLLAAIVDRVRVRSFEVAAPSLEEVFVDRVGEAPREEVAP